MDYCTICGVEYCGIHCGNVYQWLSQGFWGQLHPKVFWKVLIPTPQGESSVWTFVLHIRYLHFPFLCFIIYIEFPRLSVSMCLKICIFWTNMHACIYIDVDIYSSPMFVCVLYLSS